MATKKKVTTKTPKKKTARSTPAPRTKKSRPKRAASPKKAVAKRSNSIPFEEAKSAAIDSLIEAIEEGERRLAAVKRANSHDELAKIWDGGAA